MALTSLVSDEFQQDEDLIYKYEIPGLTWIFVGAKTPKETRKAARLQEQYPDVDYLHCLFSAATISFTGELTHYPKHYRAPVLDDDGNPIVDPKTGKYKTKAHPMAGKKMPTTPDVIATMDERVLAEINAGLAQKWLGRTPAEQEEFRGDSAPVAESVDS